jgi:broad specificity phosphatase PhoE
VTPPFSAAALLDEIPTDQTAALLLRHAERPPLTFSASDDTLPIIPEGAAQSRAFGARIGARLGTLHTSPLTRCRDTAEALRLGAGATCVPIVDRMLGAPGVYVADAAAAQETWLAHGHEAVMAHLAGTDAALLPGLAEPGAAARRLVEHLLAPARGSGLHVFVTHDSLIVATVARTLGRALPREQWPRYLEGVLLWRAEAGLVVAYRGMRMTVERGG